MRVVATLARTALLLALVAACEGAQRSGSQFVSSLSGQLQRLGETQLSTVACLGARNSGKGSLLGKLLGTSVEDTEHGVATSLDEDRQVAVLNTEGFGAHLDALSAEDEADAHSAQDTAMAVALSDVLVFNVDFREFVSDANDACGFLAELQPAMELLLRLAAEQGGGPPAKRKLFLVVRDYEKDEGVSQEQIAARFGALLDGMWASLARLPGASELQPSSLLDVQVALLPHPKLDAAAFSAAADGLKAKLAKAASADAALPASQLLAMLDLVSRIAARQRAPAAIAAAGAAELSATTACSRAATDAFDEFVASSASLHARVKQRDRRAPLDEFGPECSALISSALQAYDARARAHNGTDAFEQRRAYLRSSLLADLRPLYGESIQLAVKAAVVDFARRSANISTAAGTPFDAEVQGAVDFAVTGFRMGAAALCPPEAAGLWTAALEERMLLQELQSMSAEMVRRAQLHGLYMPPVPRVPTGVSLHWLHPNPFGKDMRTDQLTASDRLAYSERAKELLRSSPMRLRSSPGADGPKVTASAFSGGIKLTDEDLVIKEERRRRR